MLHLTPPQASLRACRSRNCSEPQGLLKQVVKPGLRSRTRLPPLSDPHPMLCYQDRQTCLAKASLLTKAAPEASRAESVRDKAVWPSALLSWFHSLARWQSCCLSLRCHRGKSVTNQTVDPLHHYDIKILIFHPKVC